MTGWRQHMEGNAEVRSTMVDLAYALDAPQGGAVPFDYRTVLAHALQARMPWLAQTPGAGVHRLRLVPGGGGQALLARRTRLVLRLPRERLAQARDLEGATLMLGEHALKVGAMQARELLPWGTLYAHIVAFGAVGAAVAETAPDEAAFMAEVDEALRRLGVACRTICGRHQVLQAGALQGYSLMLDSLSAPHSLRLLEQGIGGHRRLGCGLFVPHKSAAAVGTPP